MRNRLLRLVCVVLSCFSPVVAQGEFPAIERRLPPVGIDLPAEDQKALAAGAEKVRERLRAVAKKSERTARVPDVEIFLKAVDYALEQGEFWKPAEIDHARELLGVAEERLSELARGSRPWRGATGAVVRGYVSALDDSVQPYGLVIAEDLDLQQASPLYVWLHGRADSKTDLQFIRERLHARESSAPRGALVLHPFGRYCNAFKSAGEIDVLEAIAHVRAEYSIDPDRIVLMGFSMGGAGAWHLGAHYAGTWVAVAPGAGFAETARYNRLSPEEYPPAYEQRLWGLYDVPAYVRNLFNTRVVAYSGENDKQIQAARVMEEAFAAHGQTLQHIIGPGMGHRYHPESRAEIDRIAAAAASRGRDAFPRRLTLQTRTLRYGRMRWLEVTGLLEHWRDSRIDADWTDAPHLKVKTLNVSSFIVRRPRSDVALAGLRLTIDDQPLREVETDPAAGEVGFVLDSGAWRQSADAAGLPGLRKRPGLQGPIDDVFMEPFLVVTPGKPSPRARLGRWMDFELAHLKDRWRRLFRGDIRVKIDRDVSPADIERFHLVLWGDRESNAMIARVIDNLPVRWSAGDVAVGDKAFDAATHVPVMIYPNPLRPDRYIVLNSGITFREGHDQTNSLQNPKLPDWAILDLSTPPDGLSAGKVADAGFFDERWKVKASP